MPWIKFNLIERPYHNKNGSLLGRSLYTDRYGLKEIYGGGRVYPDIIDQKDKIFEWCEKDGVLLLKIDITDAEAKEHETKDEKRKYKASPKVEMEYNYKDFKAKVLNDNQAKTLKEDFFGVKPIAVGSGVTN